jgi:class 3 adenylate cyclase
VENQLEAPELLDLFYDAAFRHFGARKQQTYHRRVAKLVGDGFLVVHEYEPRNLTMFSSTLHDLISEVLAFRVDFYERLRRSTIHQTGKLRCAFGLAFGQGVRLTIPGYPLDYVSHKINFASRLVGVADADELVFEIDLWDRLDPGDLPSRRREMRQPKKMETVELGVAALDAK